jgi:hypothetical protein
MLNLITALAGFLGIMALAVIGALGLGWLYANWGSLIRMILPLPPVIAVDPVVGQVDALKDSYHRWQSLPKETPSNSESDSSGDSDGGGSD